MQIALKSSHSLALVVEDILNYTRLERKIQKTLETPFQLDELLQEVLELHHSTAHHKGLSFSVHQDKNLPNELVGDRFKIKQILGNLIGNAIKFTETGGVQLSAGQETTEALPGRINICFHVTDTGIGIPQEKLDYIFQRFSQVDESHTRAFGGLGLGLAVATEEAAIMGGRITAESTPGKGSTFIFTCQVGLGENRSIQ